MFWMISYLCIASTCTVAPPTRVFLLETACETALKETKPPTGAKGVCVATAEITLNSPSYSITGSAGSGTYFLGR